MSNFVNPLELSYLLLDTSLIDVRRCDVIIRTSDGRNIEVLVQSGGKEQSFVGKDLIVGSSQPIVFFPRVSYIGPTTYFMIQRGPFEYPNSDIEGCLVTHTDIKTVNLLRPDEASVSDVTTTYSIKDFDHYHIADQHWFVKKLRCDSDILQIGCKHREFLVEHISVMDSGTLTVLGR